MKKFYMLLAILMAFVLTSCQGHEHQFTGSFAHSEEGHWHVCSCGEKDQVVAHEGGEATCTEYALCSICGTEYGELAEHEYNILKDDETHHWYECECGAKLEEVEHSGGEATCTEHALCSICGTEYGELAEHQYTKLEKDETHHWYKCECGAKLEEVGHSGGEATCTEYALCSVCGAEYGELKEHVYDNLMHTETHHWYECDCGLIDLKAKHSGGEATCTEYAKCSVCDANYGKLKDHKYDNLTYNEIYHWNECVCKDSLEEIPHTFGEGKVTLAPTADSDGERSYKCTGCDYVKVEPIKKIDGVEVDAYPAFTNPDAIYYDGNIYSYGGYDGKRTDAIYCYNIYGNKTYKLNNVKLNAATSSHRAVLVGDKVYIFGGTTGAARKDYVLVHDLTNNTMTTLLEETPIKGMNCMQIGYYNNKFYILGGSTGVAGNNKDIWRFDLETKEFTKLEVTLPNINLKAAWIRVDQYLYVFGGIGSSRYDTIIRFDMEKEEIQTMNGKLSEPIAQCRVAYDGNGNIYIYGGSVTLSVNPGWALTDKVHKYNIATDTCTLEEYRLPLAIANHSVVTTPLGIYIIGGDTAYKNIIFKHTSEGIVEVVEPIHVAHTGGEATYEHGPICSVCGKEYGEALS